jgi:hypothetical protein
MACNNHGRYKLDDAPREHLLATVKRLVMALDRMREQLRTRVPLEDWPPNIQANMRHQRMKWIWGQKKKRLMDLLNQCLPIIGDGDLAAAINYELAHDEFLYQRKVVRRTTARGRRRQRRSSRKWYRLKPRKEKGAGREKS